MGQSALTDNEDDLDDADPFSSSGNTRGSLGKNRGFHGGPGSSMKGDTIPQKPMTELEVAEMDVKQAEEKLQTSQTDLEQEKKALEEARVLLKNKEERKQNFFTVFGQFFQGTQPSLGNFEEELEVCRSNVSSGEEKIREKEKALEEATKNRDQKKEALTRLQEEEKKKKEEEDRVAQEQADAPVKAPVDVLQDAETVPADPASLVVNGEDSVKAVEDAPKKGLGFEGAKAYWNTLPWEEKKKIFSVRNAFLEKLEDAARDNVFLWEDCVERFGTSEFGSVLDEEEIAKIKDSEDKKGIALLLVITAHQLGELKRFEAMIGD